MTAAFDLGYVRQEEEPLLAPPRSEVGAVGWLRANLFSSATNVVLTLLGIALVAFAAPPIVRWAFVDAVWTGDKNACAAPGAGACWAFVAAKFQQFIYGRFPVEERWRVDLVALLLVVGLIPMAIPRVPFKRANAVFLLAIFPLAATILLTGGHFGVSPALIPGLLVFAALATGLIAFAAAGRQSRFFAGFLAPVAALSGLLPIVLFGLTALIDIDAFRGIIDRITVYFTIPTYGPAGEIQVALFGLVFRADIVALVAAMAVAVVAGVIGILASRGRPGAGLATTLWTGVGIVGVVAFFLGFDFGLLPVETPLWGGLMVTLVVAVVGIVASMPLGVILALGRRSRLPAVRFCSVGFIEFVRGVPLITVLFMASVMLPLFLPPGSSFDKLLRALLGVALFSAAYMAEVVRGGLQGIPLGQYEASRALGFGYFRMMQLVVLPQALKIVIPGIVNSFISLFKDTSLVLIIGIYDLLGIVQLGFNDPNWASPYTPAAGYVFAGAVFWLFCFSMSRYSIFTERRLNTGHRG